MADLSSVLHKIYYKPGGVAALSGIAALHREAERKLGQKISRKAVRDWLHKQYVYLRHKKVRKPKGRRLPTVPIVLTNTHIALDCDLAQFDKSRSKFGLFCIDQFSNKGYIQPMVNKSAKTTAKAMQKIIDEQAGGLWPSRIRTDAGREFFQQYDQLLKDNKVKHSITDANQKSGFSESFIGKFRSKLEKSRTLTGKQDWTQHWRNVLHTLNSTPQARTKIAPNDVNETNLGVVFERKMAAQQKRVKQFEIFPVGTPVRISLTKSSFFQKSSKPSFSGEVFFVREIRNTKPVRTYLLDDSTGNNLKAPFYPYELVRAEPNYNLHRRIAKIHSKRGKQFLVSFQEYPTSVQQWVTEAELKKLRGNYE